MKLVPITSITRYVTVRKSQVVRIRRYKTELVYGPETVEDEEIVWGTCLESEPDQLTEVGTLTAVLSTIGEQLQVSAAAYASPTRFANMVADAFDLGAVISEASRGRWAMGDRFSSPQRYCVINATSAHIEFFTWRHDPLFGESVHTQGIYTNSFSLETFAPPEQQLEVADRKLDS